MQQYFSAGWVFPVNRGPIKNGVVETTDDGKIVGVYSETEAAQLELKNIQHYEGAIVPGFVNTHCHLELSHMRSKLPERTGLINFIKGVLQFREAKDTDIIAAAKQADKEMYENGIVAVGDISNRTITAIVKQESKIYYHTFLEVLGFREETAAEVFSGALKLSGDFAGLKTSVVPHAPYSVSNALFKEIAGHSEKNENLISIHNQETVAENQFFESRTGGFLEFFDFLGIEVRGGEPAGMNSLRFHLPKLPKDQRVLLVHNTFTSVDDVRFALDGHQQLYWCLCPNANLYIEDSLPDGAMLQRAGARITLGTDSLASNHQLNILDEMLVLQERKRIDLSTLLSWATLNGADFLGISARFGSIEAGKKPGLNLIDITSEFNIKNNEVIKLI